MAPGEAAVLGEAEAEAGEEASPLAELLGRDVFVFVSSSPVESWSLSFFSSSFGVLVGAVLLFEGRGVSSTTGWSSPGRLSPPVPGWETAESFVSWTEYQRPTNSSTARAAAISARILIRLREAAADPAGATGPGVDGAGAGLTAAGFGAAVPGAGSGAVGGTESGAAVGGVGSGTPCAGSAGAGTDTASGGASSWAAAARRAWSAVSQRPSRVFLSRPRRVQSRSTAARGMNAAPLRTRFHEERE